MNTFENPRINTWLQYGEGEGFLGHLRDTSLARIWCRQAIQNELASGGSLLEIGVGGLNERIALNDFLSSHLPITYTGTDWAPNFVAHGKKMFPNDLWFEMDIQKGADRHIPTADIVYSQHVLEHCGGLCPALPNALSLANRKFINIFFLPCRDHDVVNFSQYPRYHNTYSYDHIRTVCLHHGFSAVFHEFENRSEPHFETVLVATRK